MAKMKIIDPKNLSIEDQEYVKAGNPLIVIRTQGKSKKIYYDRLIWDGKDFIYIPEELKL